MLTADKVLKASDVQSLSNPDAIASFFLGLGYNVDARIAQTPSALGITNESLTRHINHIEQIAAQEGYFKVYLFEMKSMRVSDRQALARAFRNAAGDFLLVLTSDYDSLDFVLLERILPEGDSTGISRRQVIVRPRVLTVERSKPDPVALRVLQRFTYTESDVFAQFEKLLSAYTVAEWSEPLFNNRALFSDYYLKERLPDTSEWQEGPSAIFGEVRRLMAGVRTRLINQIEAVARTQLLEPILEALGFTWTAGRDSGSAGEEPDYYLYDPEAGQDSPPLAACLAYTWNRYLDGRDNTRDTETPDENPGAQVVSLLGRGDVPYVIVTNGKLWRLYAAEAHSRATNYYEIDLEEALASPDRAEAFRYFWLFFRMRAFVPHDEVRNGETRTLSFLDRMVEDSQVFAKQLGERLKERVFEEIFPHFAEGFIEYIRQQEGKQAEIDQGRLDNIYQGTLTFLYRLMFLLYAEARDLLPVKEVRGYWEVSLERLKREIAERAGNIYDEAPNKLRKAYRADSTELYDRLNELFRVIDQGAPDLNVPRYNGGLFITEPRQDSTSQEAITARFLLEHKIPDRYLALGLDRLARDLDDKTHALVMVDFKSLGVRQLGSIYEGLLEFKLRIAPEKMAIVKGKRTEEIVPYSKASKKKILKTGRGQNATERTLPKGAVYLENTRQERKATGSYYTPDYIVKYIVEHTVGPVLDEKFAALKPRLREAERLYRAARQRAEGFKKAGQPPDDPEKVWNRDDMLRLAYDVLDIKVLDPAMGSGHFLVEAVDFITDRMLNFLNGFPHNPVRAALRRTREAILNAMEDQHVSVDQGRLTDVALLKRQVLKRCVYGVDLNHMAVELAKVSLWLDAFTLGAPLSFLDHHLRWGNSLIGAMARDADAELSKGSAGQMTLWSGPFVGLLRSAEIMRGIGMLADATIEQAERSALLFREFEEAARPYKQLLDVFVIRHFGVKRADEFLRLYGVDVMAADPDSSRLPEPYKEVLRERERLYRQYRFFHWDLEFPEVFIDLDLAEWKENAGFDAVVGNPPYDELSQDALGRPIEEMPFFEASDFARPALGNRINIYRLFVARAMQITRGEGRQCFIVPMSILADSFTLDLRKHLLNRAYVEKVEAFPQKDDPHDRVFFDAKLSTCIYVARKVIPQPDALTVVRTHPGRSIIPTSPAYVAAYRDLIAFDESGSSIPTLSEAGWELAVKLSSNPDFLKLGEIAKAYPGELMINAGFKPYLSAEPNQYEIIRGAYVNPFYLADKAKQGETLFLLRDKYLQDHAASEKAFHHERERIVYQRYAAIDNYRRLIATILPSGFFASHTLGYLWGIEMYDPLYVLALFNSPVLNWRFNVTSTNNNINGYEVEALPIPRVHFSMPANERNRYNNTARGLYEQLVADGRNDILAFADERMAAGQTDVIHDVLAFLAQQMIDLNKQKQAEAKRFLNWLEEQIGAKIDDLSGKTIIRGYLGDYQKSEGELPFEELYDRLYRNRRKIAANLGDKTFEARVRREYEASLGVLLPIKRQLAHTDRLIDLIVYKLYGLTDEEIAIVEGRV